MRLARRSAVLAFAACSLALGARPQPQDAATGLREKLKAHAALAQLDFVASQAFEPVALLFQRPENAADGFEKSLANTHGPWLVKMREVFTAQYVQRLGLKRRADRALDALVLLQTEDDFASFAKTIAEPNAFSHLAYYDASLGAVVAFEHGDASVVRSVKRIAELTQFTRGLIDAHTASASVHVPYWVSEGLGAYLSFHTGTSSNVLDQRVLDAQTLEKLVEFAHEIKRRPHMLMPLEQLIQMPNLAACRRKLLEGAPKNLLPLLREREMYDALLAVAWLFTAYLHEAENGKYRAGYDTYLRSALAGSGGLDAFARSFPGTTPQQLEGAFYAWVYQQYAAAVPGASVDIRTLDGLGKKATAAAAPGAAAANAFEPRALALAPNDADGQRARALVDVRAGRLDAAIARLEKLARRDDLGAARAIVERELVRTQKFLALRDAHFADLVNSGRKYSFEYQSKKVAAVVTGYADGKLLLGENKQKLESVPISAFDPYVLAREMSKQVTGGADGWVRYFLYALAGDEKWINQFKAPAEEAAELKSDAKAYPAALRVGAAGELLDWLSEKGQPADLQAATACVEAIATLRKSYADVEQVKAREAPLRTMARIALELQFDPSSLTGACAGKIESLPDGRVRITYEFDRKEELADFPADHGYWPSWRAQLPALSDTRPQVEAVRGALRASGAVCVRHAWTFEAPITLRYKFAFEGLEGEQGASPVLMVAACDDRAESFVGCAGFGSLDARDLPSGFRKTDMTKEGRAIHDGEPYEVELAIADGKATSKVDGSPAKEVESGPRTSGELFLYVHSKPTVAFDRLVIEGRPEPSGMRAKWIERRLAELGL